MTAKIIDISYKENGCKSRLVVIVEGTSGDVKVIYDEIRKLET
jgi:hypothetical protein